jgi:hypothetical protein
MPSGKCRICLQQDDSEILEKIKNILKYTGPLVQKPPKNLRCKPSIELCIDRQKFAQDLIKLGCIPNKSMKLVFPTEQQVPKNLVRHFVRGYFDGDGSTNRGVMIVGTLMFCNKLIEVLPCKITNVYQRYTDRLPLDSSHQLFIGLSSEILKFYHWLYDDSTIWLTRKRNKFDLVKYVKIIESSKCKKYIIE